jgi:hypothetical protein
MNPKIVMFIVVMLGATFAMAHHSFDVEFDSKNIQTHTGIVTKVDWANPHAFIFMDVKDPNNVSKTYRFELGPPYSLTRGGWKRDTVKIGDRITVEGAAMARDGSPSGGALQTTQLVLSTGQKLPMR